MKTNAPAYPTLEQGDRVDDWNTKYGFTKREVIAKDLLTASIMNFPQSEKVNYIYYPDGIRERLIKQAVEMTDPLIKELSR